MVEAGTPPRVDVIIITALKEEYDAVLRVATGASPGSDWKKEPGPTGLEVASRTFQAARGGRLSVVVTQALEMGGEAIASAVSPLIREYKPRCLAMSGVCAGRKGEVELGDVIIADRLWNYESGKRERKRTSSGRWVQRFKGRNLSYPIDPLWKQRAASFQPDSESPWLAERPLPYAFQMEWVLDCLLRGEDPARHPQRKMRCADYPRVLSLLREQGWIRKHQTRLTKAGEQYIQQRREEHPEGLPEPKPFRVHVGPIATGNKVTKDPEIFEKLSETDYKVLGLEMEASAIGALAHLHRLEYMLVMKGVMDFADPAKNDNFKHFAAGASAECLLAFLREHLPANTADTARKPPDARVLTKALADYKRTRAEDPSIRQLNLRGLAGIAPGPHQTELDLLDFAVAPSLHDATEQEGSREAVLRLELSKRNLEPTRRRELEVELTWREHARWAHHGGRPHPTLSFARALHRFRRFVIIGDPGAGKSVLTRLALLACTEGEAGHRARLLLTGNDRYEREVGEAIMSLGKLLPVRLTLGGLGRPLTEEGLSLEECIRQELRRQRAPEPLIESLDELLAAGRLFLILDGLDEVPARQRAHVADAVAALARLYPEVRLLATSRPNGYHPRIQGFDYTRLAPLHESQQHALVSRLHHLVETHHRGDEHAVERARRRTHALLSAIKTRREWQELSSNPLLLTLCALTSADTEGLPKHRVFLFENFIRTILVQWRSEVSPEAESQLLEAWSAVASTLVQREERHPGVLEVYLLRLLDDAIGHMRAPVLVDAETALRLAIETGLVRKEEETVAFWHSTFAEFLAALALTGNKGRGAAERLLKADHLPLLVLQFAAARLEHVLKAFPEVDELAKGLLARDEEGEGRLLRPGLRAVSACMSDGVDFNPELVLRVWCTWTELLETTAPSPLWEEFGKLTERAPRPQLPALLVARLADIDDRGIEEVRRGRARLVAPSGGSERSALEACKRWLEKSADDTLKLYGALGLASAGLWTDAVIETLGRFRATWWELSPGSVGQVVRHAPPLKLERMQELVRMRLASDEPMSSSSEQPQEHGPRALRLSAACLLAVGGLWNEEVARVLRMTLAGRPSTQREDEAKFVVRYCANEVSVQNALLDWMSDSSTLGDYAREIINDVAPIIKDLPAAVLKRTASAEGKPREELESLLVSIGEERTTLLETLRYWLGSQQTTQEQKRCAASILLRLSPRDGPLHEALRHGMRQSDCMERVRWAHLALGRVRELSDAALATLQACARSPAQAVRELVYTGVRVSRGWLLEQPLEGWLACASDRGVPAAARLEAVKLLAGAPACSARLTTLLRELLDTDDPAVRVEVLGSLSSLDGLDVHAATLAAEEAARTGSEAAIRVLLRGRVFTLEILQAYLRALPAEALSTDSGTRSEQLSRWHFHLAERAARDPSCLKLLLDTLEHPTLAGEAAADILSDMLFKRLPVHDAFRKHLARAAESSNQVALRRLVNLGLGYAETSRAASEASRAIDLNSLSPWQLGWLALHLNAHAPEDAIRMWWLVLEGEDLELVLQAAAKLARHCPEKAPVRLQPALSRLLTSSNPSNRLDASSLALEYGLLEQEASTALLGCLGLNGQEYEVEWSTNAVFFDTHRSAIEFRRDGNPLMKNLLFRRQRIDFMAMHVLCSYRPGLGLPRLAEWLEEKDEERFTCAVRLLATRADYREAVRVALEHRLDSAPSTQLEHLMGLVETCGFFSTGMAAQMLARYDVEHPSFEDIEQCLLGCLRTHPELWALIRRQGPARRAVFARLLEANVPITPDTVTFAVELAFEHVHLSDLVWRLKSWCSPSSREGAKAKELSHHRQRVRGWLREALDERALPSDLDTILLFDELAAVGEVPTERRIGVLRGALAIDISALESEEAGRSYLLGQQAKAGLRLLALRGHDERLVPILEAAVYERTSLLNEEHFQLASTLLTLRPVDEPLRKFLIRSAIHPGLGSSLELELEVLQQQVRLSSEELVDVLSARFESHTLRSPTEAPAIFDALERFGCEQKLRASLLLALVSRCGEELPVHTRLVLAERAELPASDAAKLLLSVIARAGRDAREAAQRWLKRFATQRVKSDDEEQRLRHADSSYLSHRLQVMETLSPVDDPAWLDQLLAELSGTPTDRGAALCRQAREERHRLSPVDWAELMAWLTVKPGDEDSTQLGKQWLTLRLWMELEPSTVTTLLRS